jgi:hypothetical protein
MNFVLIYIIDKKHTCKFFLTSYSVQWVGKSMGTSEGTINGISNDFAWIGTMVKP